MLMKSDIQDFLAWARNSPPSECENPAKLTEKLCLLGRHDYEFVENTPDGARLQCFYCEQGKVTIRKNQKEDR